MILVHFMILIKVLVDGLHDPDSPLSMLHWPNDVRDPVMSEIWTKVTEDWEVFSKFIIFIVIEKNIL